MSPGTQDAGRSLIAVVPSMGLGGAERQLYLLLRALSRMGWTVSLIALDARGPFYDEAAAAGITVHYFGARRRDFLSAIGRLTRVFRRINADVLLLRGFSAATLGRIAAAISGRRTKVVVAEHSTDRQKGRRWWHDVVERALIPLTDAFVGVANAQTDYLVEEKGIPRALLSTIHNGIDFEPFQHSTRADARALLGIGPNISVVGIVAALRPEKDHATFLRAARVMADCLPDACFIIVGDGPERGAVKSMVETLGLQQNVRLLGSRADVHLLFPAFDVFCLSSTSEAFPMTAIEAMGCGLPVVATLVGGLPELVEQGVTGFLVQPGDSVALAQHWISLCQNPDLAHSLGQSGMRKALAEYSDTRMAEAHAMLFERLIERPSRRR